MSNDTELQNSVDNNQGAEQQSSLDKFANMSESEQAAEFGRRFYRPDDNRQQEPQETQDNEGQPAQEEGQEQQPETSTETAQKLKFKENGQDVEVDVNTLIDVYQKAKHFERQEEYTKEMQRLAEQRRQAEAYAQPRQQEQPQHFQPNPIQQMEQFNNMVTQRAMQMLGIADPGEFNPDATGLIGNKAHFAAYQKAMLDISNEETQRRYETQRQEQERQTVDAKKNEWLAEVQADPNGNDVVQYAEKALFSLRISDNPKDNAEFNRLMPAYIRFTSQQATVSDIDALKQFYKEQHTAYYKARSAPKNPPVKPAANEKPGAGEATPNKLTPQQFAKLNKDQQAAVLGQMYEAKTKRKGW